MRTISAIWHDVLGRQHNIVSAHNDTQEGFLRMLHGFIGPQWPIQINGLDGILTCSDGVVMFATLTIGKN